MPNMEYPGPCPSCAGIDGCPAIRTKEEAVAHYCAGLEMEINAWKARLFDVLSHRRAAEISGQIMLLKTTVRELEALIAEMRLICPIDLAHQEKRFSRKLNDLRSHYTEAMETLNPTWFGV